MVHDPSRPPIYRPLLYRTVFEVESELYDKSIWFSNKRVTGCSGLANLPRHNEQSVVCGVSTEYKSNS